MPEGDTILKLARRISPAILGETVVHLAFEGRRSVTVPRRPVVSSVETHGKHLLIGLDRRRLLRVHLGLHGRVRGTGSTEPRPRGRSVHLVLETEQRRLVGTRLRSVELFGAGQRAEHPVLSTLGPDLLADPVPYDVILERLRSLQGERAVADVLLDQRVAAGLGNVYQNELRSLFGVHPDCLARDLSDATWTSMYTEGARQLAFNLTTRLRKTTFDVHGRPMSGVPRHWVYGRAGERCLRCGQGSIVRSRSREHARPGFHCPRCQLHPHARGAVTR